MQKNTRNMVSPDAYDPDFFLAKPGSAGPAQLSLLNLIETVNAFFPKTRVNHELKTDFSGEIIMMIRKEVSER
jgi:hypothetical protein